MFQFKLTKLSKFWYGMQVRLAKSHFSNAIWYSFVLLSY